MSPTRKSLQDSKSIKNKYHFAKEKYSDYELEIYPSVNKHTRSSKFLSYILDHYGREIYGDYNIHNTFIKRMFHNFPNFSASRMDSKDGRLRLIIFEGYEILDLEIIQEKVHCNFATSLLTESLHYLIQI